MKRDLGSHPSREILSSHTLTVVACLHLESDHCGFDRERVKVISSRIENMEMRYMERHRGFIRIAQSPAQAFKSKVGNLN